MQGLIVINREGNAPSAEEISAAHSLANTHKGFMGVMRVVDPVNGVDVEYHGYKNIAYVMGDIGAYFGFADTVKMRCWRKALSVSFSDSGGRTLNGSGTYFIGFTDGTVLLSGEFSWSGNTSGLTAYAEWDAHQTITIYTVSSGVYVATPHHVDIAEDEAIANTNINTFDKSNLSLQLPRQHITRKKCSDGLYELLRNSFLPPELESFIKTQAPLSSRLRRKVHMQVVAGPTYSVISSGPAGIYPRVQIGESTVTLQYKTVENEIEVVHEQTFTGRVEQTQVRHLDPVNGAVSDSYTHVFTDYPVLSSQQPTSGDTYYPNDESLYQNFNFNFETAVNPTPGLIVPDKIVSINPTMFSIVNGTWVVSANNPTDQYFSHLNGNFSPSQRVGAFSPPIPNNVNSLTFTHPEFLLSYLKDSHPVEAKDGEEPSMDWLSSRLIDGEEVAVIPLSFILDDGTDRGMFILSKTSEHVAFIKVTGYAKTRFNYASRSFSEPKWIPLAEEKLIPYDSAWSIPNCICIGSKNPWSDTKAAAQLQKKSISDSPPDGYVLTAEERLYKEIRTAIRSS